MQIRIDTYRYDPLSCHPLPRVFFFVFTIFTIFLFFVFTVFSLSSVVFSSRFPLPIPESQTLATPLAVAATARHQPLPSRP